MQTHADQMAYIAEENAAELKREGQRHSKQVGGRRGRTAAKQPVRNVNHLGESGMVKLCRYQRCVSWGSCGGERGGEAEYRGDGVGQKAFGALAPARLENSASCARGWKSGDRWPSGPPGRECDSCPAALRGHGITPATGLCSCVSRPIRRKTPRPSRDLDLGEARRKKDWRDVGIDPYRRGVPITHAFKSAARRRDDPERARPRGNADGRESA